MASKGLTYFRLKSPYEGDITKNCALDGYEVDSNFFTLEGRDIKSVNVNDDELVVTLMNGETISSLTAFSNFTKDIKFDFDAAHGVLYVTRNGVTQAIEGFVTAYNAGEAAVATDGTVKGNGRPSKPVGISPMSKAGMYRPVTKLVDTTQGETLPLPHNLTPGDRFLSLESISEYGFLYNYDAVRKIACDLAACNSPWRIPTKEDWDDMLDAVEPCAENREHSSATCNRYFGKFAGKFLKSKDKWKLESGKVDSSTCFDYGNPACTCGNNVTCSSSTCGEYGSCLQKPKLYPNKGIDSFGFGVMPAGYTDDGGQCGYFLERAWYWTASNKQYSTAYTKRFEFNRSTVYQDVIAGSCNLSLRLVKDYNGDNYLEREDILGTPYSAVLMPSMKKGKSIWTATNIAFSNSLYNPVYPNNGMGVSLKTAYFMNEWDGKRWLKKELLEGESVVIMNAPNGTSGAEYRIVNGDLIATSTLIYNEVMDAMTDITDNLQEQITNEITRAVARENEIETNLNAEIERATAKEAELEQLINDNSSASEASVAEINAKIESLTTALSEETAAREEADATLQSNINAETEARTAADADLQEQITQETTAREEADTALQEQVTQEVADRKDADDALQAAIETEIAERKEADAELQTAIDSLKDVVTDNNETIVSNLEEEVAARKAADDALQANINAETEARTAADADLQEQITQETTAREEADTALQEQVTQEVADRKDADDALQAAIETEIAERKEADAVLQGHVDDVDAALIAGEGSAFDSETGILTLKRKGGEDDVEIQFSFNFGTI